MNKKLSFVAALLAAATMLGAHAAQAEDSQGLAAAAAKLDALDKRITRLEDLNQIERLQRVYGYFVDKGQWSQLSELFADDATLEIGGKGLFLGKPHVLKYMHEAF